MDRAREKKWAEDSWLRGEAESPSSEEMEVPEGHDPRVYDFRWRHAIPLKNGQVTPGTKDTSLDLREFELPDDLFTGKTVADVGACDGFFSFHAEKMGASKVLGIDPYRWTLDDRWSGMDGFNLAREILESKVEDDVTLLEELSPENVGKWDVSLFLGVFYHLVNPIQILKNICDITNETIVVETINAEFYTLRTGAPHTKTKEGRIIVNEFFVKQPMLSYYPTNEVEGDFTTWYAPNPAFIENFLRVEGFNDIKTKRIYNGSRFITIARR
tara:strand:- start:398 stop:1210 length:813 start_codon:yes stop_codon:yes gene_type:complete